MELQYFGANCFRINTKKAQIVIDDNLSQLGLKTITKASDISLRTSERMPVHESMFVADKPGEYEVSGIIINGISARAHMDEESKESATIYTIEADGVKTAFLGHIHPDLTDDHLEQIGMVDVAVVPVGNSGYTLDGVGALQVIKKIEPKLVIPSHYADKAIKYEVPQTELAEALKALGMETTETVDRYKYKPAELSDTMQLVVLNRQ